MSEDKSCYDCGHCYEYPQFDSCNCYERGCHNITDDKEANNCPYYDDDSWMK